MFGKDQTLVASPDPLTEARATVDRLAAALAKAEAEAADARIAYDRAMHNYVARGIGKDAPSQDAQRAAEARAESLKRLLSEARILLERLTREATDAARIASIQASGSLLASLTTTAEAKLTAFEAAVATVRLAETELFTALFDQSSGLKQQLADPAAKKDAHWCRGRLARRAIELAEQGRCLIDARFEIDGEDHFGQLETHFYRHAVGAGA